MQRRDRENYYLDIAQAVLGRGTCLRRNFGAIIVKNDQILATGPRARRGGGRTAAIWASACGKSWGFPGGSGTSCADRCTRRPTPSSTPPAAK